MLNLRLRRATCGFTDPAIAVSSFNAPNRVLASIENGKLVQTRKEQLDNI